MQSNTLSGAMAASSIWGHVGVLSPPIPEIALWPQADFAGEAFSSSPGQANRALHQPAAGINRLASTVSLGPASPKPGVWGHGWNVTDMGYGQELALAKSECPCLASGSAAPGCISGVSGAQTSQSGPQRHRIPWAQLHNQDVHCPCGHYEAGLHHARRLPCARGG